MDTEILVAEREMSEQALRESVLRYNTLLASISDCVYAVTMDRGRAVATSHGPGCEAITGFTSREFDVDASLWYRMIHEENRPAVLAQVVRMVNGEEPRPLEHRIIHKDGEVRWLRNVPVPQRDPQGQLVSYPGLISDITERKRAEQSVAVQYAVTRQLAESGTLPEALQRILKAICETLPWDWAAFWSYDAKTNALQWSGIWHSPLIHREEFAQACQALSFALGVGLPGRAWASSQPAWIPDVVQDTDLPRAAVAERAELHGACGLPIRRGEEIAGVIELLSRKLQPLDPHVKQMLTAVGVQIGLFLDRQWAQEAPTTERNLLRTVIDNLPDCIYAKDTASRFVLNNLAHLRVVGAGQPQDVRAKTDLDFFPEELALRYRADEEGVLQSGRPLLNREEPVVDPARNRQWVLTTKVPWKDSHGQIVGLIGVSRDITERKQADEKQRLSEARLQAILNNSPAVTYLKDSQGRYLLVNCGFEALFHVKREEVVGKTDEDLFPQEMADAFRANDEKVMASLAALEFEEVAPHDYGPHTYISVKFPLVDAAGTAYAVCGISTDISERKQAEDQLRRSYQTRAMLNDLFGRCLCGRAAASGKTEFAGHVDDRHETCYEGMTPHGHYCTPIVSAGKVLGVINLYVKENHRRESKEDEFLNAVANVVGGIIQRKRAEQQLKQALADVTTAHEQLKATHEELKATELQLIQAAKLECVGTLAAGVAHEVKNPLQTVLMGLDYLGQNLPPGKDGAALAISDMREAVTRADAIVRELLELAAAPKSERKPEDLNACVERSLDLLRYEFVAAKTTVARQLALALPLVAMDRSKMEQVFIDLFINSLHAISQRGTLTVTTRAVSWSEKLPSQECLFRQFKSGDTLAVIEVQDTGTGIPESLLPKVFDPFFTTKPVGHGTGLGLAVVKEIVDLHGGAIAIRNAPPGGVRVTLILKLQREK
jgi:PAS domain S-box-containing protein